MTWQLFVSLRYLTAKRKEKFISIINLISILGVGIGVAALIIVISVMSGFDNDLKDKIIGTYSHIEILSDYGIKPSEELSRKVSNAKHVMATAYFLNGQALIRRDENVLGIILKGIEPNNEMRVNKLGEYIVRGNLDLGASGVVIGSELAAKLKVDVGSSITIVSPAYVEGEKFKVSGIFTSGMYEYDSNLAYIDLPKAQELLAVHGIASGIAVKIDDALSVTNVRKILQETLGDQYVVRTWMDLNKNLLAALKLEKTVMFLILTMIVMVACFNISSALIMTVLEKTKEIGILKAIGASNLDVMRIFATQGFLIGFFGTAIGTLGGVSLAWCLKTYKFISLPKDIYYIDKLPVNLEVPDILAIIISALAISLIATIYPSYKAAKLDPVEALRYE